MRSLLIFLISLTIPSTVYLLKCTVCEFKLQPPHNSACNETCEGDVCFIVVNKYFNGTINAGCMHLHEDDSFEKKAVCQRGAHDNRCACSISDNCNNPNVSISKYKFTETPILENYQWLPQIQPPMPSLQPIIPPEEIPMGGDMNETATELENGVEKELVHELEDRNVTQILRNEENDDLLTVTTTIGLNVRDHTNRINTSNGGSSTQTQQHHNNDDEDNTSTTMRSFTPGQGSVEVTKVTQESPSETPKMDISRRNLTTDGNDKGPNSTGSIHVLFAIFIPLLAQYFL